MHKELAFIREKPGLSLGMHMDSFVALCGFITGYQVGYGAGEYAVAGPVLPEERERAALRACLVTPGFDRFVAKYYGEEYPAGGRGYAWFIREHSTGDRDAFRLFFELMDEYDRRHPDA